MILGSVNSFLFSVDIALYFGKKLFGRLTGGLSLSSVLKFPLVSFGFTVPITSLPTESSVVTRREIGVLIPSCFLILGVTAPEYSYLFIGSFKCVTSEVALGYLACDPFRATEEVKTFLCSYDEPSLGKFYFLGIS